MASPFTCRANTSAKAECIVDYLSAVGTKVQIDGGKYGSVSLGKNVGNTIDYVSGTVINEEQVEFLKNIENGSAATYTVVPTFSTYTLSDSIVGTPEVFVKFTSAVQSSMYQAYSSGGVNLSREDVNNMYPTNYINIKANVGNRPSQVKFYDFALTVCQCKGDLMGTGPFISR